MGFPRLSLRVIPHGPVYAAEATGTNSRRARRTGTKATERFIASLSTDWYLRLTLGRTTCPQASSTTPLCWGLRLPRVPSTNEYKAMFIGNVPKLQFYITQKFLDINGLKRKDIIITFARMVVKRSWFDSLREAGGPPGFAQIDQNYMDWLEEEVHEGRADQ